MYIIYTYVHAAVCYVTYDLLSSDQITIKRTRYGKLDVQDLIARPFFNTDWLNVTCKHTSTGDMWQIMTCAGGEFTPLYIDCIRESASDCS